jgi:hypothetical protein
MVLNNCLALSHVTDCQHGSRLDSLTFFYINLCEYLKNKFYCKFIIISYYCYVLYYNKYLFSTE